MGKDSAISWTNHTFNPWHGCWKIADECLHCYAETTANRFVDVHGELWGRTNPRRFFGDAHWNEPRKWNRAAIAAGVRERVFVGSMCDWAEIHPNPEIRRQMEAYRGRLFELINECRGLDWLLLTKRIGDVADHDLLPWLNVPDGCDGSAPWPHVWLMTTAGTRKALRENVPVLRSIPAAVRGISCEPMLEDIPRKMWDDALAPFGTGPLGTIRRDGGVTRPHTGIDWLIVGDESGHGRRPAQADWIRTAREACAAHRVAFHFKQWNGAEVGGIASPVPGERKGRKIHLPMLDGRQHAGFPK